VPAGEIVRRVSHDQGLARRTQERRAAIGDREIGRLYDAGRSDRLSQELVDICDLFITFWHCLAGATLALEDSKRLMRKKIISLIAPCILFVASVHAHQRPGFYAGAHVGYSNLNPDYSEPAFSTRVKDPNVDGFAGGVILGYHRECIGLDLGLEGDFGLVDAQASVPSSEAGNFTAFDVEWNSHLRLRVAVPAGKGKVFAAAGVAFTRLRVFDVYMGQSDTKESTLSGLTLGLGFEHPVSERVQLRLEGLYDDYESDSYRASPAEGQWSPTALHVRAAVTCTI
jgi:opacity protein-like surface antigen